MQDLSTVRAAFTDPQEFWSSPLNRGLCAVTAADPSLVELAAHARAGQGPTFLFCAAIHALVLDGADHPLAQYYVSRFGDRVREVDAELGPALKSFADEHAEQLRAILRTRLVQTNHVQRAVGLRIGLAAVAASVGRRPAHLLEVGASAGLVLRQDAYGYELGGRVFGDRHSPVRLRADWRSSAAVPDLDLVPTLASTTGIDLNPLDPRADADRRWLRALVWPEDTQKAALLGRALSLAMQVPVEIRAGDAIDRCPEWARQVPPGDVRIVFHCATRMHVPADVRPAFDAALAGIGENGPLYRIEIEGDGLVVTGPDDEAIAVYDVDGHLAWAAAR